MSQESDTPKDSKFVRLKLTPGEVPGSSKESAQSEESASASPSSEMREAPKKAISFKKADADAEGKQTSAPAGKELKQVPLKGVKKTPAAPDPLLDPDIEIAFEASKFKKQTRPQKTAQTDKPAPQAAEPIAPEGPTPASESKPVADNESAPKKLGLGVKSSTGAEKEAEPAPAEAEDEKPEKQKDSGKSTLLILAAVLILLLALGGYFGWMIFAGSGEAPAPAPAATRPAPEPEPSAPEPSPVEAQPVVAAAPTPEPEPRVPTVDTPLTAAEPEPESHPVVEKVNQLAATTDTARALVEDHNQQRAMIAEMDGGNSAPAPTPEPSAAEDVIITLPAEAPAPIPVERAKPVAEAVAYNPNENSGFIRTDIAPENVPGIPLTPEVSAWVSGVSISSYSESLQRASIGPIVFQKGERVNDELEVTLFHIKGRYIYFQDSRGAVYSKPL